MPTSGKTKTGVFGAGLNCVDNRRQRLDVDNDRFGAIAGRCDPLSHDHRHRFPDETNNVAGKPGPNHAGPEPVDIAREVPQFGRDINRGENSQDPSTAQRGGYIDFAQPPVRDGGTDVYNVGCTG